MKLIAPACAMSSKCCIADIGHMCRAKLEQKQAEREAEEDLREERKQDKEEAVFERKMQAKATVISLMELMSFPLLVAAL